MSYPEKISNHLKKLICEDDTHILASMFQKDPKEECIKPLELSDPLGGSAYSVTERAVHHYRNRLLVLVTDNCAAHCRYCFRRSTTGLGKGTLSDEELARITAYLKQHREITEVILSGGDPFTLGNSALETLLCGITQARPDMVLRIGTRMPVVSPERFHDNELTALLASFDSLWIMTHINHVKELSPETKKALYILKKAGLSLANQTVLLNRINDNTEDLKTLFNSLTQLGIKPYYLFQGDLARGTSHFRVPLSRSLKLVEELRRELSGLAMPVFAVDIPGGGGKIPLQAPYLGELGDKGWHLTHPDGSEGYYPEEKDG